MTDRGVWPDDTRGIVDPGAMRRIVDFARYPAGDALEGVIDWFWSVSWMLPDGVVHDQEVLNHPGGHISIGTVDDTGVPLDPAQGRVYGVLTGVSNRRLTGSGWTVAAKTTTGGLGVLIDRPAREITDQELDLSAALPGLDGGRLVTDVRAASDPTERVDLLRRALCSLPADRDPTLVAEARIIEAAEAAVDAVDFDDPNDWSGWSTLSDRLGYADQAHLIRDFRLHLGTTPGQYRERNR